MKINPVFILQKEFDSTGLLINTTTNKVYSLNHTGVLILDGLLANKSKGSIILDLQTSTENAPEQLNEEFERFVQNLEKIGAVSAEETA